MKKAKQLSAAILCSALLLGGAKNIKAAAWYDSGLDFVSKHKIELSDQLTGKEIAKALSSFAGKEVTFSEKDALTRDYLAKLLVEALEAKGIVLNDDASFIQKVSDFSHVKNSKDFAKVYNLGVMVGDGAALDPEGKVTKQQFAQVLRAMNEIPSLTGKVAEVTKHGNVLTDISMESLEKAGIQLGDLVTIQVGDHKIVAPYGDNYSNVDNKKPIALGDVKKTKNMIVALNMADFAKTYGAKAGDEITITLQGKGLYLEEYHIRSIDKKRTYDRKDYSSDAVYANFREIKMGTIAPKTLYRTSSPIDPELKRAEYADKLIQEAGVKTVLNFAQSDEEIKKNIAAETFHSPYYKELFEKGSVKALSMGVDFTQKEFNEKLKSGLEFMISHPAPYAIHCTEGKDRAGFVSALLEMLGGASKQEIMEDYMISYENYYHVQKGSEQYNKIMHSNIEKTLMYIAGVKTPEELNSVSLQGAAVKYLVNTVGLTQEQVQMLEGCLSGKALPTDKKDLVKETPAKKDEKTEGQAKESGTKNVVEKIKTEEKAAEQKPAA